MEHKVHVIFDPKMEMVLSEYLIFYGIQLVKDALDRHTIIPQYFFPRRVYKFPNGIECSVICDSYEGIRDHRRSIYKDDNLPIKREGLFEIYLSNIGEDDDDDHNIYELKWQNANNILFYLHSLPSAKLICWDELISLSHEKEVGDEEKVTSIRGQEKDNMIKL